MPPGGSIANRATLEDTPSVDHAEHDVTQVLTQELGQDVVQKNSSLEDGSGEKPAASGSATHPFAEKIFLTVLLFWSYGVMVSGMFG